MESQIEDVVQERPVSSRRHGRILGFATLAILVTVSSLTNWPDFHPSVASAASGHDGRQITAGLYPDLAPEQILATDLFNVSAAEAIRANAERAPDGAIERMADFIYPGDAQDRRTAEYCLAAAGYYEAGDDPAGQTAVMQVVLNRVRHPDYPNSICGVVFQGYERATGCQFTFTCDGALRRNPSVAAWRRASEKAVAALDGEIDRRVGTSTHYHADYVLPRWSSGLQKLTQIDAHVFYRFPGRPGSARAFRNLPTGRETYPSSLVRVLRSVGERFENVVEDPGEAEAELALTGRSADLMSGSPINGGTSTGPLASANFELLDAGQPAGRWAVNALRRCSGQSDCVVLGYDESAKIARSRNSPTYIIERPLFLFVRDSASGMDLAFWNCERIERTQSDECLPGSDEAVARLLR